MTDLTPCHTGPAALTCGFDAALREVDVDTAELAAVTGGALRTALLRELMNAITCRACAVPYGQPHLSTCVQQNPRAGSPDVGNHDLGGIVVLSGARDV